VDDGPRDVGHQGAEGVLAGSARFLGQPIDDVTTVNLDEVEAAGRLVYNGKEGS